MREEHFICDLCKDKFNLAKINQKILKINFEYESEMTNFDYDDLEICESCTIKLINWIESNMKE